MNLNGLFQETLPPPKFVGELQYINVILVVENKVIQNNLFINESAAESNFVNLICEYAYTQENVTKEWAANYIKSKVFNFPNGSITINRPVIKFQ